MSSPFRAGIVAIVGRPNTGKSSLINALFGTKMAMVSKQAGTTRVPLRTVWHGDGYQIVFTDTPGLHISGQQWSTQMQNHIRETLEGADIILLLADATRAWGSEDAQLAELLAPLPQPKVLWVNKMDEAPAQVARLHRYASELQLAAALGGSALKKQGTAELLEALRELLPEHPAYYPEDVETDQHWRDSIAEMVREQLLHLLRDEVPHELAVVCTDLEVAEETTETGKQIIRGRIQIDVAKRSHLPIVLGPGGKQLGLVRRRAESSASLHLYHNESKVKLEIDVRVANEGGQAGSAANARVRR